MGRPGQGEGRGAGVAVGPGATLSADGRALWRETICGGELQHDEGNVTKVKEGPGKVWSLTWLEQLLQDARFGARTLGKNPGFAMVAVATLALGIGANTAIFSVVEGVVLAPLPYPHPDRLVMVSESRPSIHQLGVSYPDYQDWRRSSHSFAQMAVVASRSY